MENSQISKDDPKNAPLDVERRVKSVLKKWRRQFEATRKKEKKAYYGDIWENSSEHRPYENHIFRIIETEVPILTDGFPAATIDTDIVEMKPQAQTLTKAIEWVNEDQCFSLQLPVAIRNALTAWPGWLHEYYDANADNGQGKIIREIIEGEYVYPDGSSAFIEGSSKFYFEVFRQRDWLELNYPKHKKKIRELAQSFNFESDDDGQEKRETKDTNGRFSRKIPTQYRDNDLIKLKTTYIKDYSLVSIPDEITSQELQEEGEALKSNNSPDVSKGQNHSAHIETHLNERAQFLDGVGAPPEASFEQLAQLVDQIVQSAPESQEMLGQMLLKIKILENHIQEHEILQRENPEGKMFKYPNAWRVIESVGSVVLYDGPSKYDHNEIPLTPFYCYKDGTVIGFSEIRNLLDSQQMQAVMGYKEYKGLQRVANPNILVTHESGLTKDDISNEDGGVYEVNSINDLKHMDPGVVSTQLGSFQNDKLKTMQDISGLQEATEGKTPHPNASGFAIKKLQNQSVGRVRLKGRQNEQYSIRRMTKITASNILQFWTTDKLLGVNDNDEQIVFNPIEMMDLDYKVQIVTGSMAGVDKEAYNALLFAFLQNGNLQFDQYLKVVQDLPGSNKMLEMVDRESQIQETIQTLQQENLMMKVQFAPETLTPDELKMAEELGLGAQQPGVNTDQPGLT